MITFCNLHKLLISIAYTSDFILRKFLRKQYFLN